MGSIRIFTVANPETGSSTNVVRRYTEVFTATDEITISHNLGEYPQVTILNQSKQEISAEVIHLSVNETKLVFTGYTLTAHEVIMDVGARLNIDKNYIYAGALPVASVSYAGQTWIIQQTGLPDEVFICLRNADATYSWKSIALGNI